MKVRYLVLLFMLGAFWGGVQAFLTTPAPAPRPITSPKVTVSNGAGDQLELEPIPRPASSGKQSSPTGVDKVVRDRSAAPTERSGKRKSEPNAAPTSRPERQPTREPPRREDRDGSDSTPPPRGACLDPEAVERRAIEILEEELLRNGNGARREDRAWQMTVFRLERETCGAGVELKKEEVFRKVRES